MSEETVERIYTIPLSQAWATPTNRRTKRAISLVKEFATKHLKAKEVKISRDVNELIWTRGIRHPPRRISVKMVKDEDGIVTVSVPEEKRPPKTPTAPPPSEKETSEQSRS